MNGEKRRSRAPRIPTLRVRTDQGREYSFSRSFHIGRDGACEVQIQDVHVGRRHALVSYAEGHWSVHDLQSLNGVVVDGHRVEVAAIVERLTIQLGADGPSLVLEPQLASAPVHAPAERQPGAERRQDESILLEDDAERYYFAPTSGEDEVGGRTLMIRRAFEKIQQGQRRRHGAIVAAVALAALCSGGYALYRDLQMRAHDRTVEELFYQMKSIDVGIANVQQLVARSGTPESRAEVARLVEQRRQLENSYDQLASGLYDRKLTEQERLILRVTRTFGEYDLAAPPDYMAEVARYINRWKSTNLFRQGVERARNLEYTPRIAQEFLEQNLPPEFFYLALWESNFDAYSIGPPTRMGYAKGMWMFIKETGERYGLKAGPLAALQTLDLQDDRNDWRKATRAAAQYIRDLYATDAQASGLLVMASYNWGEGRVINLLKTMPSNPRERNFWKLLQNHRSRVPPETYNYVFHIVAAAVIGENPRLFGFDFDNPLGFLKNADTSPVEAGLAARTSEAAPQTIEAPPR
jgi:hypothetical protein